MSTKTSWRQQSKWFFNERAEHISTEVTPEHLCYVSGREQRLWTNPALYQDLMDSIRHQLDLRPDCSLLEVGCAAGFLARGLAERVGRYTGVDIAARAVAVARNLGIANAEFVVGDGTQLPWPDATFDRTICYDVFTNFPNFQSVAQVVRDMVRVTRLGGKILAGSLPDDACKEEFQQRVSRVVSDLDQHCGPVKPVPEKLTLFGRVRGWFLRRVKRIQPQIVCYYFRREDFLALGQELGLKTDIFDIHSRNPYRGFRFNVVYTR
jgi:ubiquinone/menaquinone biosynthesis C-methylase UbiE